jgi:SNF2 family DNA or RNA helicase
MVLKIKENSYTCPFCGNKLESKSSKCFNTYCQGQKFNLDNLVIYRLNPSYGIGRIIKKIEIPASKTLDDEDTFFITKYKVLFKNNLVKILHPIDLVHKIFTVNERVITERGVGVINSENFLIKDGMISYEIMFPNGKKYQISEADIISKYEPTPKRVILKQKIDPPKQFLIKYWANLFYSYYTSYQIKCITNSRLSLMPHQISIAHRLSEEAFPRVILADEVGLGKTIEAGIYIKEMIARNLADRILIIVPASLVKQWVFEMENKFNIFFTIYDGKQVKVIKKNNYKNLENPFYYDNVIITSLQFARNPKYANLLSQISWDIVIFDEAHHLRRYLVNATTGNYRETRNFTLAKKISQNCQSLLLLTATPLQLHSFELYSLIELIYPEAFEEFSDFEHFRKNMPFINLLVVNINQIDKLNTFELKNTIKLLKNLGYVNKSDKTEVIISNLRKNDYKSRLLDNIERDHTLSQYIIRNRKKNVFPEEILNKRIVKSILVESTKKELELYNEIRLYLAKIYNSALSKENIGIGFVIATLQKLLTSSKHAILKSIERRLDQIDKLKSISDTQRTDSEYEDEIYESIFEEDYLDSDLDVDQNLKIDLINQEKILSEFHQKLKELNYDSKADKLLELIHQIYRQNPKEKILLFTQFVDTLFFLKDLLQSQEMQINVQIFYGGLDKEQKDESVEKFRAADEFSVLLSTEIGGEGRNFQFSRILINYDLPWNPMKLEQRIGRLDRIGQESREIYIYNFFIDNTIETDIMFALNKRINLFEESIGILEPIIGKIEKEIKDIIFTTENDGQKRKKLNEFYRTLNDEIKRAKEIEMQLDDLMIDKKSFQIDSLISSLASCQEVKFSHNELFLFIKYFFDLDKHRFGNFEIVQQYPNNPTNPQNSLVKITLNSLLKNELNYSLSKEYVGTFSLDLARQKEEILFFALGHPLIDQIIDFCKHSSFRGFFTLLTLNKSAIHDISLINLDNYDELYLFIFSVKFQGYIIENQISAIIVDAKGNEIEHLAEIVLDIEKFTKILDFEINEFQTISIDSEDIDLLRQKAKNHVKWKTSIWKREIKALNDKIFNLEKVKKKKIYAHKRKLLHLKLESEEQKLERKKNQRPSTRQLENISKLSSNKKKEKLETIRSLEEEITFIQTDIHEIKKKIDDLSFEYEDLKKDIIKKNVNKYYTNVLAFAILKLDN